MMETTMDIRNLVMQNLSGSTREEIEGYIQDTVDTREEEALPGMGILFEVVWKKLDTSEKNNIMDKIMQEIQTT
ncbi:MAG: small acid-soluble spore protein SspI [Tepidanaerobacteraceae bacterium]